MPDPRRLMSSQHMEAISVLRHALQLLDALDLPVEAALVSEALETMTAAVRTASRAGAE